MQSTPPPPPHHKSTCPTCFLIFYIQSIGILQSRKTMELCSRCLFWYSVGCGWPVRCGNDSPCGRGHRRRLMLACLHGLQPFFSFSFPCAVHFFLLHYFSTMNGKAVPCDQQSKFMDNRNLLQCPWITWTQIEVQTKHRPGMGIGCRSTDFRWKKKCPPPKIKQSAQIRM